MSRGLSAEAHTALLMQLVSVPPAKLIEGLAAAGVWGYCAHWRCGCKAAPSPASKGGPAHYTCMYHRRPLEPQFVAFEPLDWSLSEDELSAIAREHGREPYDGRG